MGMQLSSVEVTFFEYRLKNETNWAITSITYNYAGFTSTYNYAGFTSKYPLAPLPSFGEMKRKLSEGPFIPLH